MGLQGSETAPAQRVQRDQENAQRASELAVRELAHLRSPTLSGSGLHGPNAFDAVRLGHAEKRRAALEAIADDPFQAMVEVYTELVGEGGKLQEKEQLWYTNAAASTNEVLKGPNGSVNVLAWTHPGIQLALSTEIGDYKDAKANGYRLLSVEPLAKARFDSTLPQISGVYQPGGAVRPAKATVPPKTGLKAVKLNMTRDQVLAFVSRMSGLMIVTGAPGSGKTTVAFQRIRFLFDQQDQREGGGRLVPYTPELLCVFLANENLADQAKGLLANQLNIPTFVVEFVGDFVARLTWYPWCTRAREARPREERRIEDRHRLQAAKWAWVANVWRARCRQRVAGGQRRPRRGTGPALRPPATRWRACYTGHPRSARPLPPARTWTSIAAATAADAARSSATPHG